MQEPVERVAHRRAGDVVVRIGGRVVVRADEPGPPGSVEPVLHRRRGLDVPEWEPAGVDHRQRRLGELGRGRRDRSVVDFPDGGRDRDAAVAELGAGVPAGTAVRAAAGASPRWQPLATLSWRIPPPRPSVRVSWLADSSVECHRNSAGAGAAVRRPATCQCTSHELENDVRTLLRSAGILALSGVLISLAALAFRKQPRKS
ncbi:hypothetical protein GCM10027174_27620 [Salinifilum aidingensis]